MSTIDPSIQWLDHYFHTPLWHLPLCYILSACDDGPKGLLIPRSPKFESQLRLQWQSPSDILSLLLILGPEIVQRALAQLVGPRYVPIAFSFGWVAYSFTALLAVAGGKAAVQNV